MRWRVFALVAMGAAAIEWGAFGPLPWHEAAGASASARMEVASPAAVDRPASARVASGTATFSLFEDFPFGVGETGWGAAFRGAFETPPIALDPDPQRFGPGRPAALLPDELGFGPDQALGSEDLGAAVLETVLSDPLLRDLFGPGPLAQFFADVLSAARGEGRPTVVAEGSADAAGSRPRSSRDQARTPPPPAFSFPIALASRPVVQTLGGPAVADATGSSGSGASLPPPGVPDHATGPGGALPDSGQGLPGNDPTPGALPHEPDVIYPPPPPPAMVAEPGAFVLFGSAVIGLAALARGRRA